ncbi:MAG: 50S ribosomal protein L24 [Candidatus Portnoybacteria bacterium]|nr:50S ribosomal protein L24 [Candidatus Portnoybacteria bacterium]
MNSMKIKKGDNVIMLSGKDKGKTGKVTKVIPKETKIIVDGLNLMTKHVRPRRQGEKGSKIQLPRAIHASKVKLVCPKCSKPARVGFRVQGEKKERMCKKCLRAV